MGRDWRGWLVSVPAGNRAFAYALATDPRVELADHAGNGGRTSFFFEENLDGRPVTVQATPVKADQARVSGAVIVFEKPPKAGHLVFTVAKGYAAFLAASKDEMQARARVMADVPCSPKEKPHGSEG